MPICAACEQLRHRPSGIAPHPALRPAGLSLVADNGTVESPARYLCRMCGTIMIRGAMDDNSDPVWDLYAG